MPVRIYDISKKLGLENKEVLSKAKELGIAAARVASSSLDKITAEYLEQQIIQDHPGLAAPPAASPAAATPTAHEPIVVVSAPPPETQAVREPETATATAILEPPEVTPMQAEPEAIAAPQHLFPETPAAP